MLVSKKVFHRRVSFFYLQKLFGQPYIISPRAIAVIYAITPLPGIKSCNPYLTYLTAFLSAIRLYALAKAGKIKDFTGIDSPYEEPLNPEIICHTQYESIESSITKVIQVLEEWGYICSPADNGQKQSISND